MPRVDSDLLYKNAITEHGITPQGLCWLSAMHQQIRFSTILSLLPEDLSDARVVDAGCGFGDFYSYLCNNGIKVKEYIGIDTLEEMCIIAKKRTKQTIIHANIIKAELPTADYYICSGALNILTPFETLQFIKNCYKASKKGFIFNALYGEKESNIYNYLSSESIKKIAKELHVKSVKYENEYLENDVTVGFF